MGDIRTRMVTGAACVAVAVSSAVQAQEARQFDFDLPAQPLKYALRNATRASGFELFARSEDLKGRLSSSLKGRYTLQDALDLILKDTGLVATITGQSVFIRGRAAPRTAERGMADAAETDIIVTGSRIRGAAPTAPVTTVSQSQMRDTGRNDLGEVIRSLPQNFNGGQNPGVTFTAGGTNQNLSSASSLNLRGLGSDATLTLLNGHRMAYDSVDQGIDISSIPIAAIDRLEIVADGASALYGSDAVGGVANIILRRDYDGLDTRVRLGTATDGGDFQQQYSAVGGTRWSTGGLIASVNVDRATDISARQRSVTHSIPGDTTLLPNEHAVSSVIAGHQTLGGSVEFSVDGYYTRRNSETISAFDPAGFLAYGDRYSSRLRSSGVTPKLSIGFAGNWTASLLGTYGNDRLKAQEDIVFGGTRFASYLIGYENSLKLVEASAEGGVIDLPAGSARLAIGGGYRSSALKGTASNDSGGAMSQTLDFNERRDSAFAYAELYGPLVQPSLSIPGIRTLAVTAAGRFEHYSGVASIFTPKTGLIYEPIAGITLKGSWGKSFKAPTLNQLAQPRNVSLANASDFSSAYPDAATVLYTDGGNPNLKPERATTWTATLELTPAFLHGARFAASYFHVTYRNRILAPLITRAGALDDPIYRQFVTLAPSASALDAIITDAPDGLFNGVGTPYDPASVVAIVDNRFQNISRFRAEGVDISASLPLELGDLGKATLAGSASYLDSSQINVAGAAEAQRAGTISNPPHWRSRFEATWQIADLTVTPAFNVVGSVVDRRDSPFVRTRGMETADLTIRYQNKQTGPLHGLEIGISLLNIANRKPGRIRVPASYYPAYDSTNYSVIGRQLSLTIGKRW